ncbi:hypothetical protein [Thalassolituus marinus]|jgi:hypothetical protein|uniref:Uncharacterized protein n=1 Tax=Thalassolituus marinus TaxID=671053 RepID=A0ABS7ZU81_9GAMM|nr:hypothetical protein [Thalassolituus marinus]MCA6065259.1 hypothetical protein [Thalassolituus marinus]
MAKHPGTSGLMPVKGSGCGIRPDPDAMTDDIGFDFSAAASLNKAPTEKTTEVTESDDKAQPK